MSFIRAEIATVLRLWREPIGWSVALFVGLWLIGQGYLNGAPLSFALGVLCGAIGLGLLPDSIRRVRFSAAAPSEGVVLIDEARIVYMGPRDGGVVDLPAIVAVEIVTRPHVPPASPHAWVITAEDGTRLTIPLGAEGAERLVSALTPLPGIDFDAGVAAVAGTGARRTVVWRKAG